MDAQHNMTHSEVFRMLLEYKEAKYIDKQYCTGDSAAVEHLPADQGHRRQVRIGSRSASRPFWP